MKQSQYMVYYQDNPEAHMRYFGPMVNISHASEFMSSLPKPLKGGRKGWVVTEPYGFNDLEPAKDAILNERQRLLAS